MIVRVCGSTKLFGSSVPSTPQTSSPFCLMLSSSSARAAAETSRTRASVHAKARAVHERLIVLDTHLDTPAHLVWNGWSILDRHRVEDDGSQIDLPRMIEGGLDGGFFAVYTPQGPVTPEGDIAARDAGLLR